MCEVVREMRVLMVDMQCPDCGKGHMRPTGFMLCRNPPAYPHECNKCGYVLSYLNISYPYAKYSRAVK
jgi:transposase-like protein